MKKKENKNNWPATLYVEGQDQFRGWFNSSLITSVILANQPPYQQVLSHGFVVDEKGYKMSKSLGNVINPEEISEKFGADILRLWVTSSDFTKEIKISLNILENLQESYQKIRNTLRFLLGNLANLPLELTSEKDLEKELNPVDYYILHKLEELTAASQKNYREYSFNLVYSSLLNFCINDLSSFYFEISKDGLYCDELNSPRRKKKITTLYYLLKGLLKIISPALPFLAEEVYQNIPFGFGFAGQESIHLADFSTGFSSPINSEEEIKTITKFLLLRQDVYRALEKARQEKIITANTQADLVIYLPKKNNCAYSKLNLSELLLVSAVMIEEKEAPPYYWKGDFCSVKIKKTSQERCLRCWNYQNCENNFCRRCKILLEQKIET